MDFCRCFANFLGKWYPLINRLSPLNSIFFRRATGNLQDLGVQTTLMDKVQIHPTGEGRKMMALGWDAEIWSNSKLRKIDVTLPKTNIAPTNGWLEYYFPIGEAYFQGLR